MTYVLVLDECVWLLLNNTMYDGISREIPYWSFRKL